VANLFYPFSSVALWLQHGFKQEELFDLLYAHIHTKS
jgi:hypothetical protein